MGSTFGGIVSGLTKGLSGKGATATKGRANIARVLKKFIGRRGKPPTGGPKTASSEDTFAQPKFYRRGGRVRKTGIAMVHRGEVVVPAKRAKGRRGRKRYKR